MLKISIYKKNSKHWAIEQTWALNVDIRPLPSLGTFTLPTNHHTGDEEQSPSWENNRRENINKVSSSAIRKRNNEVWRNSPKIWRRQIARPRHSAVRRGARKASKSTPSTICRSKHPSEFSEPFCSEQLDGCSLSGRNSVFTFTKMWQPAKHCSDSEKVMLNYTEHPKIYQNIYFRWILLGFSLLTFQLSLVMFQIVWPAHCWLVAQNCYCWD